MVAEGPDGPVTFAFRVVGVEDCGGASSQHFLVVQRTARLAAAASAGRQHIRHQSSGELNSCSRDGSPESAVVRASSFWLRDRIAEGSCPRGATSAGRAARACAKCDNRRQTPVSAERLNDRRRNRHRRHFNEQRERASAASRRGPGRARPQQAAPPQQARRPTWRPTS